MKLAKISRDLVRDLAPLEFAEPVTHVYNPLDYARKPHEAYLKRWGTRGARTLMLGMNPGPWGMAQTGVPFGDVVLVQEYLGVSGKVQRPDPEHPKRPVQGFDCPRREVSGSRLWGWAQKRFPEAEDFFSTFFVWNYCPLSFMEAGGRNRTPDKLPASEREPLFEICDRALRRVIEALEVETVLGIGKFAEDRAKLALADVEVEFGRVLHPSPASPAANRGWEAAAERDLARCGFPLP